MPESSAESQTWKFDGFTPSMYSVHKVRRTPKIGQIAGEVGAVSPDGKATGKASCMMDQMPSGSIMSTTLIVTPQDHVQRHINRIAEKSKGESVDATMARRACDTAKDLMGHKHKLFQAMMCVSIRGEI